MKKDVINIHSKHCDTNCVHFRWDEVADRFQAYCLKDKEYIKNMKKCNKDEVEEDTNVETPLCNN
jgi:hypothetical protein